ncbi:xanthine dehydrogenase YagR molybdenum-binding subunit [Archangium gephyra]|uniref:Periplasmic aromatic aldehyde oxidoreductase, molybdenum binding subunit YagR n=1 Tax=Archangium gephyra TaxID=48 RepID=A0AAC8TGM3_9BACT|nr:xanthine dehydrogenase family protein molybdopterin-binding subunit [Archangium gephyra]AKJ04980.1 Periplasmic aromatic aldehyde oxidoreductase, molybdenum binding subunit YagR [Archangium gephyra]REG35687.1 xanthine dehydrogenase YagR molybdenum-binding subunit [Archangium gephyra]
MTKTSTLLGKPLSRVDGRLKVTGEAKYAAEFNVSGLTHGCVVSSAIARGRIKKLDTSAALAVPGVLHVFTHENRPRAAWFDRNYQDEDAPSGSPFRPLHDDELVYSGQPIALVVAETLEVARYAASLVQVEYKTHSHETDLRARRGKAYAPREGKGGFEPPPKPRGHADKALAHAAARIDAEYSSPVEHHNPMEMHATTVVYEDDGTLSVYDKTQGVMNTQKYVSKVFHLSPDEVRVRSPFVGGAFGSGLRPQYQLFLAVMAARELKRSVRVALTRQQMFTFGHRPTTLQRVALGVSAEGKLEAVIHETVSETSRFEDYIEVIVNWSGLLYQCDNVRLDYKVAQLDTYTPIDMRAPGAAVGVYALECAMDELAYAAGIDPLELRLKNYAERDQNEDKPFSSKELRACYQQGAERFGWARRTPAPRSMREGKQLIGWGMATGVWEAMQQEASAKAVLSIDGKLIVSSATADIGTGTYTVMTQIAAETLGLPVEDVTFKLGDSSLPMSPLQGGSWTVSSVGSAVKEACEKVRERVFELARKVKHSPLAKARLDEVSFDGGHIRSKEDPSRAVSITEAMRHGEVLHIEEQTVSLPDKHKQSAYTLCTHSAVFAEVRVDEDFGTVKVTRVVSAIAGGRVLNPKTARSQILGGIVWGIGMALEEESVLDQKLGRFMNHNLAEYHVPVNADVQDIDVIFVDEEDTIVNPLGAKGLGEIGIVGVAAAIANAIFHATGKRVRNLPITPDKLL